VRRVIGQQAARATRRAIADAVIHNDGLSLDELAARVGALWDHWRSRLEGPG
jgi:dephospho-CoA kinase